MARLYDMVAALPLLPGALDPLRRAIVVVVDNVAQYGFGTGLLDDGFRVEDTPNVAPPFQLAWFEARGLRPGDPQQYGALMEVHDITSDEVEAHRRHAVQSALDAEDRKKLLAGLENLRWASVFTFVVCGGRDWPRIPSPVCRLTSFCRSDGSIPKPGTMSLEVLGPTPGHASDAEYERSGVFHTLIRVFHLAISFMHCKNVQRVTVEQPAALSKKWERKHDRPLIRYHVLDIDPMRKVLDKEGGAQETGLKKALHICRGHFATYTDEAPLFGRSTGTFWRPQHIRGSKKHGLVLKDYNVKAPKP